MSGRRGLENCGGHLQASQPIFSADQRFLVTTDHATEMLELPTICVGGLNDAPFAADGPRPTSLAVDAIPP